MKKTIIILITLLTMGRVSVAQQPIAHLAWFNKNPDNAAEAMAEKLEKINLKLKSINDIEVYEYDKQGNRTKTIKSIKRVLELPDNKLVQIEYDAQNSIKSFAISTTDISDISEFTTWFGINKWATVIEEPDMVMKVTSGYFSKFRIFNEKRASGLETRSYALFIDKEKPQNQVNKENVSPFNIDSLSIYTTDEKITHQMISLLEGIGQKYLITEAEETINNENSGDLEYYYKTVLFKDGLNFQVIRKPNNTLSEITVSCQNPILFLKIKRLMALSNMTQIEKKDNYITYQYENLEVTERPKYNVLNISIHPHQSDLAGRLSNAPTLNFNQIMGIYEKYKGDVEAKEAYVSKTFLHKVNLDWTNKTLMPDLKYNDKKDKNVFYFLSPNNKLVECMIISNITANWTAPFLINSEDTGYINRLTEEHKKSRYSTFTPVTTPVTNTRAYQFRIHDPRKEEEREKNREAEKQEKLRQDEERAASEAKAQARRNEQLQRSMNALNGVLQQIQKKN